MADNDDSSSSSSDDDEFLTKGDVDREALVRKKLLESFYGKTAVATSLEPGLTDDQEEEELSADDIESHRRKTRIDDLDSKDFDVKRYIENRIRSSSVHDLLTIEEKLALEVRTLDSTMQVKSPYWSNRQHELRISAHSSFSLISSLDFGV